MDMFLYILLSIFEGLVIFYYSFNMFRINVFDYIKEISITVVIISIGTYYYSQSQFSDYSTLLNIVCLIVALVVIFKISFLYAIFISAFGFLTFLVIQGAIILIPSMIMSMTLEEIRSNDIMRYSLQIISDSLILCFSWILNKKRIGFTFVPYSPSIRFELSKTNIIILLSSVLGIIMLATALELNNILIGSVFWIMCFMNLIYIGFKRERKADLDR